ncbi:MAG: hypothetical protein GX600_00390 [Dehalococcoidia bacterium]|nr:hypothetical protein [Dehalococcoidia bacterium]
MQEAKREGIEVAAYSEERLAELISEATGAPVEEVRSKSQFAYLVEYLGHFSSDAGGLTLVLEWQYTDRDFIEDYSAYYVRCFQGKYRSTCSRIHFFAVALDRRKFRSIVLGRMSARTEKSLADSYLGFIVLKPLPQTFFGRTCLKTYEGVNRRNYPVTREYEAHLLGLTFRYPSLAFQEQDRVAAACATSALWSCLQGTAKLFQHKIYSPVEITKIATDQFPELHRAFPNEGLTTRQMAAAIRRVGLEPETIGVAREATLQATAYAYLRAKIPLLLNVALFEAANPAKARPYRNDWASGHAVAVTGFSLGKAVAQPYPGTDTRLRASRIDKLYVHDDQVGPFARLKLNGPPLKAARNGEVADVPFTLESSWPAESRTATVYFAPFALIVPLYHKIRIKFDTVLSWVLCLDNTLSSMNLKHARAVKQLEWEVYLTTEAEFHRDIREAVGLSPSRRWRILERQLPRFIWRATGFRGKDALLDFIFDATDIDQGNFLLETIHYEKEG